MFILKSITFEDVKLKDIQINNTIDPVSYCNSVNIIKQAKINTLINSNVPNGVSN